MQKLFDFKENGYVKNDVYAKAFAARQMYWTNNGLTEDMQKNPEEWFVCVNTHNPDYQEYAIVDPWMDGQKEIDDIIANFVYGKSAVIDFIRDVAVSDLTLLKTYLSYKDGGKPYYGYLLCRLDPAGKPYYVVEVDGKSEDWAYEEDAERKLEEYMHDA